MLIGALFMACSVYVFEILTNTTFTELAAVVEITFTVVRALPMIVTHCTILNTIIVDAFTTHTREMRITWSFSVTTPIIQFTCNAIRGWAVVLFAVCTTRYCIEMR